MNRTPLLASWILLTLLLSAPSPARAVDLKKRYEEGLVRWALGQTGLELEPSPGGKVIERVEIVREDIIAQSDFWPNFFNWFHVKTRDSVVRQELLIGRGQRWNPKLVEESERNLRKMYTLAVVRAVPCKSRKPGHVVLLVVTKDLWSIRLNMKFSMVGSTVQSFLAQPTEQNFLGRNKQVSLRLRLQQLQLDGFVLKDKFSLGQLYVDERVLGTRLYLAEVFDLVFAGDVPCGGYSSDNRLSGVDVVRRATTDQWCPQSGLGDLEGAYGYLRLWRPLYSLATRWGFGAWFWANMRQVRHYRQPGPYIRTSRYEGAGGVTREVPRVYDVQEFFGAANVVRSFGGDLKLDLYAGFAAYRYRYDAPENFPFDQATRDWYKDTYLPLSQDAAFVFVTYHARDTRYVKLRHVDTFALTEDFLLGHDVKAEGRFGLGLARVSQGFIEGRLEAKYRLYRYDNMLTAKLIARARYMPALEGEGGPWVDLLLDAQVKNAFPRLWVGRFHLRLRSTTRKNDLLRTTSFLGGDTGLRGYPSLHFEGQNLITVNAEYRSLPINFFTLHLGFVVFYDGGAVYGGPDPRDQTRELPLAYRQTVGLGIRALFPQFDREVLRVDFGLPMSGSAGEVGTWFSVSFAQVWSQAPKVRSSTMIDP